MVGLSIRQITIQSAQIAGFLGGGLLAQSLSPTMGLAIDAMTFVMSALFVRFGVRRRPAARERGQRWILADGAGLAMVWRDPRLRSLAALSWLAGFCVMPEGLAAPYADSLNDGAAMAVGMIMAADPVGCVIGAFIFAKFVPESLWSKSMAPLTLLTGTPLVVCAFNPGLAVSVFLFALSGACAICYQIQVGALFVRILPDRSRAQGMGVISTGLLAVQGLGIFAGGVMATWTGPAMAVAVAGAAGIVLGASPAWKWTATRRTKASFTQPGSEVGR